MTFLRKKHEANGTQIIPFPPVKRKTGQNYIRTTKYTLLSFLPLNVYYQFNRFYNIYFLLGALSVISGASSLSPFSQIFPLVVVFTFTAMKEGIEDYARYTADKSANEQEYDVERDGKVVRVAAKDIQSGEIILLRKGEKCPVDGIVLESSSEEGECFVETADLDGETNLKRRERIEVGEERGEIETEEANEKLEVFNGRVKAGGEVVAVSMRNMVLRGMVLRNTDHVQLLAVFTGKNTKIIRNLKQRKQKTSRLERSVNLFTLAAFAFNAFLLVSSVLFENAVYRTPLPEYLGDADTNASWVCLLSLLSHL